VAGDEGGILLGKPPAAKARRSNENCRDYTVSPQGMTRLLELSRLSSIRIRSGFDNLSESQIPMLLMARIRAVIFAPALTVWSVPARMKATQTAAYKTDTNPYCRALAFK